MLLVLVVLVAILGNGGQADTSRRGRIRAQLTGYEFNYIAWELDALWRKAGQALLGFDAYASVEDEKTLVIQYLVLTGETFALEQQIETFYATPNTTPQATDNLTELRDKLAQVNTKRRDLQPLVEPIIERHVATVLAEEGFGTLGQILPPVSFRFVETPDVLIVSPRDVIQQDYAISLQPLSIAEREMIEAQVEAASPQDAAYIVGVGGVGIWPAMVIETRWAAIAYEIVAHEWAHHYLFAFASGQEYLVRPETRFINETVATVFGNAMALKILEYFYADEVAAGMLWVPDYPTLQDFIAPGRQSANHLHSPQPSRASTATLLSQLERDTAATYVLQAYRASDQAAYLDQLRNPVLTSFEQQQNGVELNRTRITTDYLLGLGRVTAAEALMESRRQLLGMRELNQAWFAFNGGYQATPDSGAGVAIEQVIVDVTDPTYVGDPIGPAVHEIAFLAPTLKDFLIAVRSVTTRDELLKALRQARTEWGLVEYMP